MSQDPPDGEGAPAAMRSPSPSKSEAEAKGATTPFEPYFNPLGLRRAESVYSISRESFSNQLSQLASLQLPQASSLAASITAIPTATAAAAALTDAAGQIRRWIEKASQVLRDLDADDDVEWAAAGGREGLGEVDNAVRRFEGLINVYVGAIEELQGRRDVSAVPPDELHAVVAQMERTIADWDKVRKALDDIKKQVELAMEWEELVNVVLGDIGLEIEDLGRLVFEMEEKRHRSMMDEAMLAEPAKGLDIVELETIIEETPAARPGAAGADLPALNVASSPLQSPIATMAQDDATLLALFARMQPLKASLDFLPMRLSSFDARAKTIFRSACEEMQDRRDELREDFKRLEKDAEGLRKELGEDRWVLVFRNAGRQAQKMCESVSRSIARVREAIDAGAQHGNPSSLAKRVESYEAKKTHYGPAIERVLAIIERGVKDRLTVNGEILRLRSDTDAQWKALEQEVRAVDASLEALHLGKNQQQLRDSISTIMSLDRSAAGSSVNTPGSSPASSVVMTGPNGSKDPITPIDLGKSLRPRASSRASSLPRPSLDRRHVSMPQAMTGAGAHATKKAPAARPPTTPRTASRLGSVSPSMGRTSATPTPATYGRPRPSMSATDGKPRWNSSVSTRDTVLGHNFKPLTLTTPSPHRKTAIPRSTSSSQYPSPLGREGSSSPSHQALASRERRQSSLSPARAQAGGRASVAGRPSVGGAGSDSTPRMRLKTAASSSQLGDGSRTARRHIGALDSTAVGEGGNDDEVATPARPKLARPASALASGRRSSVMQQAKSTLRNSVGGRDSVTGGRPSYLGAPASHRGSISGRASPAVGMPGKEVTRPAWR